MKSAKTREEEAIQVQRRRQAQQQQLTPEEQALLIQATAAQNGVKLREAELQVATELADIERDKLNLEVQKHNLKVLILSEAAGEELPFFVTNQQRRQAAVAAQAQAKAAEEAAKQGPQTERLEDLPLRLRFKVRMDQAGHVVDVTKERVDRAGKVVEENANKARRLWNRAQAWAHRNDPPIQRGNLLPPSPTPRVTTVLPERDAVDGQFTVTDTNPDDLLRELLGQ